MCWSIFSGLCDLGYDATRGTVVLWVRESVAEIHSLFELKQLVFILQTEMLRH